MRRDWVAVGRAVCMEVVRDLWSVERWERTCVQEAIATGWVLVVVSLESIARVVMPVEMSRARVRTRSRFCSCC